LAVNTHRRDLVSSDWFESECDFINVSEQQVWWDANQALVAEADAKYSSFGKPLATKLLAFTNVPSDCREGSAI
jgi:hypothetical protein